MNCSKCRKPITKADQPRMQRKTENGKLKAIYHYKCYELIRRAERGEERYLKDAPTAYSAERGNKDDLEVLAKRQKELAEDREMEDTPREWSDWREPGSVEL